MGFPRSSVVAESLADIGMPLHEVRVKNLRGKFRPHPNFMRNLSLNYFMLKKIIGSIQDDQFVLFWYLLKLDSSSVGIVYCSIQ